MEQNLKFELKITKTIQSLIKVFSTKEIVIENIFLEISEKFLNLLFISYHKTIIYELKIKIFFEDNFFKKKKKIKKNLNPEIFFKAFLSLDLEKKIFLILDKIEKIFFLEQKIIKKKIFLKEKKFNYIFSKIKFILNEKFLDEKKNFSDYFFLEENLENQYININFITDQKNSLSFFFKSIFLKKNQEFKIFLKNEKKIKFVINEIFEKKNRSVFQFENSNGINLIFNKEKIYNKNFFEYNIEFIFFLKKIFLVIF